MRIMGSSVAASLGPVASRDLIGVKRRRPCLHEAVFDGKECADEQSL
jgi:hypothetical protein